LLEKPIKFSATGIVVSTDIHLVQISTIKSGIRMRQKKKIKLCQTH